MLNLSQCPSPQSSHCQPAVTALLHSQQAEEGKKNKINKRTRRGEEEESGPSGVKIERERNVIVR